VEAIRSNLDSSERKIIIDDFNSAKGSLQALLLNIKSSNSGLNLHHMCSDIIIVCVADNVNQVMQVLGRVHRISQREPQRIWIVTLNHSFDQILQCFQTKKMVRGQTIV
jgi:SNF2 family DNA or RNA helicase